MNAQLRRIRLNQLDHNLGSLEVVRSISTPKGGWIRAIREALGMSLEPFAKRLGIASPSAALKLEQNEIDGAITLRRLRDAADALGCDLFVAFVPREPLSEQVQRQATMKAKSRMRAVSHTMALEAQNIPLREQDEMVRQLGEDLIQRGGSALWG